MRYSAIKYCPYTSVRLCFCCTGMLELNPNVLELRSSFVIALHSKTNLPPSPTPWPQHGTIIPHTSFRRLPRRGRFEVSQRSQVGRLVDLFPMQFSTSFFVTTDFLPSPYTILSTPSGQSANLVSVQERKHMLATLSELKFAALMKVAVSRPSMPHAQGGSPRPPLGS